MNKLFIILSTILLSHLNIHAVNVNWEDYYSTSFSRNADTGNVEQVVHHDDGADMSILDLDTKKLGYAKDFDISYYYANVNETNFNEAIFGSEKVTFSAGYLYNLTVTVAKADWSGDPTQNKLKITIGGNEGGNAFSFTTKDVRKESNNYPAQEFTRTFDATEENIADQKLRFTIRADKATDPQYRNPNNDRPVVNQYRILKFDLERAAIPEHKNFSLVCGIIILVTILSRRHPNRMLAVKHAESVKN